MPVCLKENLWIVGGNRGAQGDLRHHGEDMQTTHTESRSGIQIPNPEGANHRVASCFYLFITLFINSAEPGQIAVVKDKPN